MQLSNFGEYIATLQKCLLEKTRANDHFSLACHYLLTFPTAQMAIYCPARAKFS
jgi:hypothetical protein